MMTISQSKAVKKKLMAATAMLLIACIMLITASYAWFTLSTAPEVTGITTTVGANGNLEMALADASTWSNPDALISTAVGNSLDSNAGHNANITWGNLVDLSLEQYGFNKMTLNPAVLNFSGETTVNTSSMLQTPSYGTDGRVLELVKNSSTGSYDGTGFLTGTDDESYGVRAVGLSTSLSDRQLAYRSAKATINGAATTTQNTAAKSLNTNGTALAQIIVDKATGSASYDIADVTALQNIVTSLESAVTSLEDGLEAGVLAYAASKEGQTADIDATEYAAFASALSSGYTVADGVLTAGGVSVTLPTEIANMYSKINTMKSNISSAKSELNTLATGATEETTFTWAQIYEPLQRIADPDYVTVNGMTADEIKDDIDGFAAAVLGKDIVVSMESGAGIYADLADFCGDYSSNVTISVNYGGLELNGITAIMTTATSVNPTYYASLIAAVASAGSPENEASSGSAYLTSVYAYAVDLYFRTNASNSSLLLQTDAVQRIYSDSTNEETMGGGSNMTFESSSAAFDTDDVKNLMSAIRVVFINSEDSKILAFGALDMASAEVTGSEVTADLCLYEYTVAADTNLGYKITINTGENGMVKKETQSICSLQTNTATKVTAIVYLDGENITNADVANATSSMTGSVNFQFASDATLTPMEDGSLK